MTIEAISYGCLLGMVSTSHHLDGLSETKQRALGEVSSLLVWRCVV
jgi:hypothetical protein